MSLVSSGREQLSCVCPQTEMQLGGEYWEGPYPGEQPFVIVPPSLHKWWRIDSHTDSSETDGCRFGKIFVPGSNVRVRVFHIKTDIVSHPVSVAKPGPYYLLIIFLSKQQLLYRIYAHHFKRKYKLFIKIGISLTYKGLLIIFILDVKGTDNECADSKM